MKKTDIKFWTQKSFKFMATKTETIFQINLQAMKDEVEKWNAPAFSKMLLIKRMIIEKKTLSRRKVFCLHAFN